MSYVADVIITASCSEPDDDEVSEAVTAINAWLADNEYGVLESVGIRAGGNKALQARVYLGAFNYLRIDEFLQVVWRAPWEDREGVQVFIKNEHDDRFTERVRPTDEGG